MTLNQQAILDIFSAVESHALALGQFERVNMHEPENAPGNGLTAAVWVQRIAPVRAGSGLATTTGVLLLNVRIYSLMQQAPPDAIDPTMLTATVGLMAAYSGDFQLGGLIRNVDLLGGQGTPLQGQAGYLPQDGATYRVYTIDLPLIVNDIFDQAP